MAEQELSTIALEALKAMGRSTNGGHSVEEIRQKIVQTHPFLMPHTQEEKAKQKDKLRKTLLRLSDRGVIPPPTRSGSNRPNRFQPPEEEPRDYPLLILSLVLISLMLYVIVKGLMNL